MKDIKKKKHKLYYALKFIRFPPRMFLKATTISLFLQCCWSNWMCCVSLTNISCLGDWDGKRDCITHIQILQKTWIQDSHDTNVVPCVRICIILYTWLVSTYIFTCSSVRGYIRSIYWLTGKSCLSVHVSAGLVELQNS